MWGDSVAACEGQMVIGEGMLDFTKNFPVLKCHIPKRDMPTQPVHGSLNFHRTVHTDNIIGYSKDGQPTNYVTIITEAGGRIVTAFPGILA